MPYCASDNYFIPTSQDESKSVNNQAEIRNNNNNDNNNNNNDNNNLFSSLCIFSWWLLM